MMKRVTDNEYINMDFVKRIYVTNDRPIPEGLWVLIVEYESSQRELCRGDYERCHKKLISLVGGQATL